MDSDKIAQLVDPYASYTLEYIDMIMTIRANGWKVRFCEFSVVGIDFTLTFW